MLAASSLGWLTPTVARAVERPPPAPMALGDLLRLAPIRGRPVAPADLEDRVVVVAFFASWCPPCRIEFPHLNTIVERYGPAGLSVVGVNVFEDFGGLSSREQLAAFLEETQPRFSIVAGDRLTRRIFGNVDRIPTLMVFDRAGEPRERFVNERAAVERSLTVEQIARMIEPLL